MWARGLRENGADDGTRTRNRRFTKPLLYQLSYVGAHGKPRPAGTPGDDRSARENRSSEAGSVATERRIELGVLRPRRGLALRGRLGRLRCGRLGQLRCGRLGRRSSRRPWRPSATGCGAGLRLLLFGTALFAFAGGVAAGSSFTASDAGAGSLPFGAPRGRGPASSLADRPRTGGPIRRPPR